MKHRLERVNEVLKRELSDLLQREMNFEAKLVTVQQVSVTPDLKQAHVYIGVIGTEEQRRAAMAQLHDKRRVLQSDVSRRVTLKYTPQLHFELDNSIERGTRILNILEDLHLPPPGEAESESEVPQPEDESR
jgi:ribosome-binding factor A